MRILFLDIDGVLNSTQAKRRGTCDFHCTFCPIAVKNLNQLLSDLPDLNIVISSSWRFGHDLDRVNPTTGRPSLKSIFKDNGIDAERIIDYTPMRFSERPRGYEIQEWLDGHLVTKFAIVDDNSDMVHLAPFLVKTSIELGLRDSHRKDLLKLLKD